jgi:hypothetical protein
MAIARQEIAHEGTGYVPPWEELTDREREVSVMDARNYLLAAERAGLLPMTSPDSAVPPKDDYRWWLTGATIPADWLAKVTYAIHANGAEQCDCASGDEHQFLLESFGDMAVHALEAAGQLISVAERARIRQLADDSGAVFENEDGCTDPFSALLWEDGDYDEDAPDLSLIGDPDDS